MRLIRARLADADRDSVVAALDELEAEYALLPDDERVDSAFLELPVADGAVDAVLAHLRDSGLDDDAYTVVVDAAPRRPSTNTSTTSSSRGRRATAASPTPRYGSEPRT
ncbi:hypothetical protein [Halogeometricum sp. CBA1124]|uniref:hypothetical protein n=1 Tax=Halogeometricum sp. CBA1124 TaxID=2668071 RepID=UPI0018D23E4A|nr:hypothetical protein [Halogeometricum sp. CBA1124]